MPREYKLYLRDIIEAAQFIEEQTQGLSYEAFTAEKIRLKVLLHSLMVIGEAAKHVPEAVRQRAPDVPWTEIAGTRDVIVHGYFGLDLPILWHIVHEEVPALRLQIQTLLEELDNPQ